jgi:hypothetical protein
MEVHISHNFLLIVAQPGEGLCNMRTHSNSPIHYLSINQSISSNFFMLSQIVLESVSDNTGIL